MERQLKGRWLFATSIICLVYALFHFYTAGFSGFPDMRQRAIHVLFASLLGFMMYSSTKRGRRGHGIPIWDLLLAGLAIAGCVNVFIKYMPFQLNPTAATGLDLFLGATTTILIIEIGRRVIGWVFPLLTVAFIAYTFLGPFIPGYFGYSGYSWDYVVTHLYQTNLGLWGFITGVSATIVAIFLIFAGLLARTGSGELFVSLAMKLVGKVRGGPALAAVVGSSLFGTISGGSVSNVAAVGSITIPMMKRFGYKPEFAAGVEATASSGGAIMPPILAVTAFIMAQMLGIPYLKVVIASTIPAILFYAAVFCSVRFESVRLNLPPVPASEIPSWRKILTWRNLGPLVIPFVVLIGLMVEGYDIVACAFYACVSLIILYLFTDFKLSQMWVRAGLVVDGFKRGGKMIAGIAPLLVCSNIVVALINQTGFGVKLVHLVTNAAAGSQFLALVLTAVACIVIGSGIPITGAYVLVIAVLFPALTAMGILPLSGQFFIFYWTAFSTLTPPVCLAVFAAAGIAEANWIKVSWVAMRLGILAYCLPFMFAYEPAVLVLGEPGFAWSPIEQVVLVSLSAFAGVVFLTASIWGYFNSKLNILARVLFFAGAVLLFLPGLTYDILGIASVCVGLLSQPISSWLAKKLARSTRKQAD